MSPRSIPSSLRAVWKLSAAARANAPISRIADNALVRTATSASFPIEELREYRKREIHGNAYRRPDKYHLLISEEKAEPFFREHI
jgi:hypothetical protein